MSDVVFATPFRDRELAERLVCFRDITRAPADLIVVDDDLARARSRAVRMFLQGTEGKWLCFWDHDVRATPGVLAGMMAERVDCIGATYPKKRRDPDGKCRHYAHNTRGETAVTRVGQRVTSPTLELPAGFLLLSRSLLSRLWVAYEEELEDWGDGERMVLLFAQVWGTDSKGRKMLKPEDFSFTSRVRTITDPWLYVGPGSPLAHIGSHVYEGDPADVHPDPATFALDAPEDPAREPVEP